MPRCAAGEPVTARPARDHGIGRSPAGRFASAPDDATAGSSAVPGRRREAAAAAIRVLARLGARGLTHREIDRQLDWPWGSVCNYLRRRNDIFIAIAEEVTRRDIADLTVYEAGLAATHPLTIAILVDRLAPLIERWMSPAERDHAFARSEILFESMRNPEVREVAHRNIAVLEALLCRTFVRLGSPNPQKSTELLSVMMSSLHLSVQVAQHQPTEKQLRAIITSCFTLSLEQVTPAAG